MNSRTIEGTVDSRTIKGTVNSRAIEGTVNSRTIEGTVNSRTTCTVNDEDGEGSERGQHEQPTAAVAAPNAGTDRQTD